jgi:hypothetical protein
MLSQPDVRIEWFSILSIECVATLVCDVLTCKIVANLSFGIGNLTKFGNLFNGHSREKDGSTLGGRFPQEHRLCFVLVVGVRDGRTLRNGFRVLTLLPFTNPLVGLGVASLQEESTEHVVAGNGHWKTPTSID